MPCRQSFQHLTVHRDAGCICNTRPPPSLTLPCLFSRTESIRGNPANCSLIQSLRSAETHSKPMWQIHTAPCETKETDRKVEMFEVGYPLYSLQFSLPPSLLNLLYYSIRWLSLSSISDFYLAWRVQAKRRRQKFHTESRMIDKLFNTLHQTKMVQMIKMKQNGRMKLNLWGCEKYC